MTVRTRSRPAIVWVSVVFTSACSLVFDTSEEQCETNADCAARGFDDATCVDHVCQPSSEWACLGSVMWPSTGTGQVSLRIMVIDVLTGQPPAGLDVQLCPKVDVTCSQPTPSNARTTSDGMLEVTVEAGFDGYLQMSGPSITTALFFPTKRVWEDTVVPGVMPVVSQDGFDSIAEAIGTSLDPQLGHTFVMAAHCNDEPAAGVRLEVGNENPLTKRYYMVNGAPVATENATDAAGNGGFLNLDPGFTKITGYVSATGAKVGEAGFLVRAGAVSYPRIIPTPD